MKAHETSHNKAVPGAPAAAHPVEHQQYLTFSLGDQLFALEILCIREIIEYGNVTAVPMTPNFIRGVINLRGAVVPVVDLAVRFGRQARESTKRTCIVIVEFDAPSGHQVMGLVVDAVSEVIEIPAADIEPPPEFGSNVRVDFIRGMGKVANRFVTMLEVQRVLALDEIVILSDMQAAA